MLAFMAKNVVPPRRTPQGVRGLKSLHAAYARALHGRTPQGVRGLKSGVEDTGSLEFGRTPQGVRGLKC